jgi:phosphoadenosine phosphosulfate reductase
MNLLKEGIEEAVEFIRANVRQDLAYVAFSGGKDSICLAKLMDLSGVPYQLYYSRTGIDPPEVVRFIREEYPKCRFLRPKMGMWTLIRMKGFPPSRTRRYCCDVLKERPTRLRLQKELRMQRIMGMRAEESPKRATYQRVAQRSRPDKFERLLPILYWKEWMIWELIEKYQLSTPILYKWGFDRVGCVVCPFHSKKLHSMYRRRWPGFFRVFEMTMARTWLRRQADGNRMFHSSPQEFIQDWYRDSCVRLFARSDDDPLKVRGLFYND